MKRALIPIDGSAAALRALAHALDDLAPGEDSEVHLLNVQAPLIHALPNPLLSPDVVEAELRHSGEQLLAPALAQARAAGWRAVPHVRIGAAAAEIAACAAEQGCDAIVMGTRGLGKVSGLVLGSVAQKTVHLAAMPVTLVK
jgi:nucleotide-binding universal stress UspA family protein